ncbi:hypothetical protein ACFVYE_04750 [Streptomyces sp. NPDC058239]|uniref:hypothetical protein n=1 Tax=Streptomyces sp. NPDC058239 TaxID=3346395 RepID=UPI0036E08677
MADPRVGLGAFGALNRVARDLDPFLGEVLVHAPVADAVAEGAAVFEDPERQVGRHSTNA